MEAVQPEAVPAENVVQSVTTETVAAIENAAMQTETAPQAVEVVENKNDSAEAMEVVAKPQTKIADASAPATETEQTTSKVEAEEEAKVESTEPMCTGSQDMECETTPSATATQEATTPVASAEVEALVENSPADGTFTQDTAAQEATAPVASAEAPAADTSIQDAAAPATTSSNGLSLLAAYSSDVDSDTAAAADAEDSENDDVVEVPVSNTLNNASAGRPRQVVTVSSDSSSSSSDSDSDSEGEYLTALRQKIDKRMNTEDCDEDDDELDDETKPRRRQPPKVRGEMLLDELPPIDQLEITVPEDECIELGKVQSIVDQLVLVSVLPNSMLFDLDTVLFLEKGRKVLGQVFDVLGQVADPLYCVRFNSNQQIKDRGINIGDIVYCAPQTEHTQFVILSKLMQVRGSDASWENDVEPPAKFIDYSDDEAEREARWEQRKKRQRERTNSTDSVDTVSTMATETSEAAPSRQRGRRGERDNRQSMNNSNYPNGNQQQPHASQSRDSEYNYHPSYNPGSWHSNYYHNYHPPAANFNMMPGMAFPMPTHGYGYGMPAPHPYGMPPHMGMPPPMPPPQQTQHMYPSPPHAHPGYGPHPPPSSS